MSIGNSDYETAVRKAIRAKLNGDDIDPNSPLSSYKDPARIPKTDLSPACDRDQLPVNAAPDAKNQCITPHLIGREALLEREAPKRICRSCGELKPKSREWVLFREYGTLCRKCHWQLEYMIPRRRLWLQLMEIGRDEPDRYRAGYSGSVLVDSQRRHNPLGLACLIGDSQNKCVVHAGSVVCEHATYKTDAIPEKIREFMGLRSRFGSFALPDKFRGDPIIEMPGTPETFNGYESLSQMCSANASWGECMEALKVCKYMWQPSPAPDVDWWNELRSLGLR